MKAAELKRKFLEFFKSKGHIIIKSAPLIPENDPTVLFTTAGMHPIVPFLLGTAHPSGKRLADVQKCIRTGDIDKVGDDTHLTFFEMLGNWSLGDYFKKEAIEFSFEFLTSKKWLNLDINKLAISCFAGDKDAPRDDEAANIWMSMGIPKERIAFLPKENNWWGPAGETGPCGPDTEMFYWIGSEKAPKKFDPDDPKWVEIWNDVFMQYNKTKDGKYEISKQKNVDTGMGTERTSAILQGKKTVYEIELFAPIISEIKILSNTENEKYIRIIADHLKAATFILGDEVGTIPSNLGQGYVLRRLIRKSIRLGKLMGIKDKFCSKIAEAVIKIYKEEYPELVLNKDIIVKELDNEEERFSKTLETGLKQFEKINKEISGRDAFVLFSSYGFPFEMTEELAKERGIKINKKEFDIEFKKHQELSRTAAEGTFKGGLADASYENAKLHTATHLLHAALRKVLGDKVQQKGSNITPERLRFDFSFDRKLTDEEIKKVEFLVNTKIKEELVVTKKISSPEEAKEEGALAFFGHKYGDKVSVYDIRGFSKEICMGPHVENTKELGKFKITKEEAVAAGVRRIKAVLK